MINSNSNHYRITKRSKIFVILLLPVLLIGQVIGQEKEKYILGEDRKLEIVVHIIGEVRRPGEYIVLDNTNLIELLSKAGGPTEFSNLSSVTITRIDHELFTNNHNGTTRLKKGNRNINYNINDYLKSKNAIPPPKLKPGDIVLIPRNSWHKWRYTFRIIRDLSVIASVYLLYLRASR
ncbi:MAG: polysaccharide biosynthesis/export family protein [bacterium]